MKSILVLLCLSLTACATRNSSTALGGAVGAGSGALLGSIADPGKKGQYRTRNVILGTAIGGMAGMVAATVVFDRSEKEKRDAFLKGQAAATPKNAVAPQLQEPKVESRWIEGRVQGNRYIEGHFEHIIVEPSRWQSKE